MAIDTILPQNELFQKILDKNELEKDETKERCIDMVDLPCKSIAAQMGVAAMCVNAPKQGSVATKVTLGNIILLIDKKFDTFVAVFKDQNSVIGDMDFPPPQTQSAEREFRYEANKIFYKNFNLKCREIMNQYPQYRDCSPPIRMRIVPICIPSKKEIELHNEGRGLLRWKCREIEETEEWKQQDETAVDASCIVSENTIAELEEDPTDRRRLRYVVRRYEGLIALIVFEIIEALKRGLPNCSQKERKIFFFIDGDCHPIKELARQERRQRKEMSTSSEDKMMRNTVASLPAGVITKCLLKHFRIPLACGLRCTNLFYNYTNLTEAETEIVHLTMHLSAQHLPANKTPENRYIHKIELMSNGQSSVPVSWSSLYETENERTPYSIRIFSMDSDVLLRYVVCASFARQLRGGEESTFPPTISNIVFYRQMKIHVRDSLHRSAAVFPPNHADIVELVNDVETRCNEVYLNGGYASKGMHTKYDLVTCGSVQDVDIALMVMLLFGSDVNDGYIVSDSQKGLDRIRNILMEVAMFKVRDCTCPGGWKGFRKLVEQLPPSEGVCRTRLGTTRCERCKKWVVRAFMEVKSVLMALLIEKELGFGPEKVRGMQDPDSPCLSLYTAYNSTVNVMTFFFMGRGNERFYNTGMPKGYISLTTTEKIQLGVRTQMRNMAMDFTPCGVKKATPQRKGGCFPSEKRESPIDRMVTAVKKSKVLSTDNVQDHSRPSLEKMALATRFEGSDLSEFTPQFLASMIQGGTVFIDEEEEDDAASATMEGESYDNPLPYVEECRFEDAFLNLGLYRIDPAVKSVVKYGLYQTSAEHHVVSNLASKPRGKNMGPDLPVPAISRMMDLILSFIFYTVGEGLSEGKKRMPLEHMFVSANNGSSIPYSTGSTMRRALHDLTLLLYGPNIEKNVPAKVALTARVFYDEIVKEYKKYTEHLEDFEGIVLGEKYKRALEETYRPLLGLGRIADCTALAIHSLYLTLHNNEAVVHVNGRS